MTFELIVQLFEKGNFEGHYRYLHKNTPDFKFQGFDNEVSSIKIYKGPSYNENNGYYVRFYQHPNYSDLGGYKNLGPGEYPNIHVEPFDFGNIASSIKFLSSGNKNPPVESTPNNRRPVSPPIYLLVTVFEGANYQGQSRTILFNEPNFNSISFGDEVSSLVVDKGPNWANHVVNFYENKDFNGGIISPGNFGPGTRIPDLRALPYQFNNRVSSLKITRRV